MKCQSWTSLYFAIPPFLIQYRRSYYLCMILSPKIASSTDPLQIEPNSTHELLKSSAVPFLHQLQSHFLEAASCSQLSNLSRLRLILRDSIGVSLHNLSLSHVILNYTWHESGRERLCRKSMLSNYIEWYRSHIMITLWIPFLMFIERE